MVKNMFRLYLVAGLLFLVSNYYSVTPPAEDDVSCKILNEKEELKPKIKADDRSKKWEFTLQLKIQYCDDIDAIIDIGYKNEKNEEISIIGQDVENRKTIKGGRLNIKFNFDNPDDYLFPYNRYYYTVEIDPEQQNSYILKKMKLLKKKVYKEDFSFGSEEDRNTFFDTYVSKLNILVDMSKFLFDQVMNYREKFIKLKSQTEAGACRKLASEKAAFARKMLKIMMKNQDPGNIEENISINQSMCEIWRNYMDRCWIDFNGTDSCELGDITITNDEKLKEKLKLLDTQKISKVVDNDDKLKNMLATLNISMNVPEQDKEIDWYNLYTLVDNYVNSMRTKRMVFLESILENISELYGRLRDFTICLRDIIKDNQHTELVLKNGGKCPNDLKGDDINSRVSFLYEQYVKAVENIKQRINEVKYPQAIRKIKKDLLTTIGNIYGFYKNINDIIKEKKDVPETKFQEITKDKYEQYLNELKNIQNEYNNPPEHSEYSSVYSTIRDGILPNQINLINSFKEVFQSYVNNKKNFKGYPEKIKNLHKAVLDNLEYMTIKQLKSRELYSILRNEWASIAPEYEQPKIEKVDTSVKSLSDELVLTTIANKAITLVSGFKCISKEEENPETKKKKLVNIITLFNELKSQFTNNVKSVNDFISKQKYFEKVSDTKFLCNRRLVFLWLKEMIHDNTFDTLLGELIDKYTNEILQVTLPLDKQSFVKLDSLIVDLINIYDILSIKQERRVLHKDISDSVKVKTIKILDSLRENLTNVYTNIENELKTALQKTDDKSKLEEVSKLQIDKLYVDIADDETVEKPDVDNKQEKINLANKRYMFLPYSILLIKILNYIKSTENFDYIKAVVSYIDTKFISDEVRVDIIYDTLERIGINKIIPHDQVKTEYDKIVQDKDKKINDVIKARDQIADKILKKDKNAKNFKEALENASQEDRKAYLDLEIENAKITLENSIVCNICESLKNLKTKILDKIR